MKGNVMDKLVAFHGDQKVKDKYVARVEAHQKADEIIQGIYWEDGKGCAVGCTMEISDNVHQKMQDELGVPRSLAYLEDRLFERMSNENAKEFPLRFLNAIRPGADLSMVVPKLMLWMLSDPKHGLIKLATKELTIQSIKAVAALYEDKIAGKTVSDERYEKVRKAAWAAWAASDAWAAWAASDASDAWAAWAAWAASDAWAAWAAWAAKYKEAKQNAAKRMVDKLIELLQEA